MKKRILSVLLSLSLLCGALMGVAVPAQAAMVKTATCLEITAKNIGDIPAIKDNLLVNATLVSGSVYAQGQPLEYAMDGKLETFNSDSPSMTGFLIDGCAYRSDGVTTWNTDAGYAEIGFALGKATSFQSFLLAGSPADSWGQYDNRHIVYYEFYVADTFSKLFKSESRVFAYDNSAKRGDAQWIGFDEPFTAKFVGFRVVGGKYGLARIGEIGLYTGGVPSGDTVDGGDGLAPAADKAVTVTSLSTGNADQMIPSTANILQTSTVKRTDATGQADIWAHPTTWLSLYDGEARGINSTDCTTVAFGGLKEPEGADAGQDFTTVYVTFDLGSSYSIDSFMVAGQDATYGLEQFALFIGSETAQDIIKNGTKPVWDYQSKVGNGGVLLTFADTIKGQYVVLRIKTRQNSIYYQCWLSEVAATALGGGATIDPTPFDTEDEMNTLIDGKPNLIKGEAVEGKTIPYLNMMNPASLIEHEEYLTDGYINWEDTDEEKMVYYNNSHWAGVYYDMRGKVKLSGFLLANSAKNTTDQRVKTVEIYLSDDPDTLFDFTNMAAASALDVFAAGNYVDLTETNKEGRYVGLKLGGKDQYHAARMTELGLYGTYTGTIEPIPQNLLSGKNASLLEHFQVDARGIDNCTALTGPGEASKVQGKGNTGDMPSKRAVWQYEDEFFLTDGDVNTRSCQHLKIPDGALYLTELCYNTPWIVFTYYLGGAADLDTISMASSSEYLYRCSGAQFYASTKYADLFKSESLLYTSNGEQYIQDGTTDATDEEGKPYQKPVYKADPSTDTQEQQVLTYQLTPEQKQKTYRYVAVVITRPYAVMRRDDPKRLVSGGNIARLSELNATGKVVTPEEPMQSTLTATCSLGDVTMEIKPTDYDDREFYLNIARLVITEEPLGTLPASIENNWLAVDGGKVYHFRLYDKAGHQIVLNDKNREIEIHFPAKDYTQAVGIVENGTIRRLFNATTKVGGYVQAGQLNYQQFDVVNNREGAVLRDLDLRLVLLRWNTEAEANKLNGTAGHLSIADFGKANVAGAAETAPAVSPWWIALPVAALLAAGTVIILRRRKAARGEQ